MYGKYIKRILDFTLSLTSLIVLSPLMIFLYILVRINLGKPVIFKQKRPGKDEKIFTLYKFRTMKETKDEKGNLIPDSKRLTKFGKILRSTSLDELPELINIIKGDMSIVGPRPLLIEYLELYNDEQKHRHDVRPGLTGLAQISGRNAISWEEKFKDDIDYINKITFFNDAKIVLKTFKKVFKREGILDKNGEMMKKFEGNNENLEPKQVIIIGAGGHAKVIADIIEKCGDIVYGFLDDNLEMETIIANNQKWKVIGNIKKISFLLKKNKKLEYIIAIGDNKTRKKIAEEKKNLKYYSAIHPSAIIANDVKIGEGTAVMANVCINSSARIGKHCIINTASVIEHDNIIENYVHISPNATLCGTVKVGEGTHIGAGGTVKNNINITSDCIVGAGAVVVKDIAKKGIYTGIPAERFFK